MSQPLTPDAPPLDYASPDLNPFNPLLVSLIYAVANGLGEFVIDWIALEWKYGSSRHPGDFWDPAIYTAIEEGFIAVLGWFFVLCIGSVARRQMRLTSTPRTYARIMWIGLLVPVSREAIGLLWTALFHSDPTSFEVALAILPIPLATAAIILASKQR